MTDRYEQLFENKSPQEADKIIALCQFESKGEYFEHESEIVRECIRYLEEGKSEAQTAYLLRSSEQKAELSVNEGNLTAAEMHQLAKKDLSAEEIANTLDGAELEHKEEYSFIEVDSFLEIWGMIESDLTESEEEVKQEANSITLIDLQKMSSEKISVSEVLKLLPLCGLTEQDSYTQEQAKVFSECCELRGQGKSSQEIAQHFGIARGTEDNPVKQLVKNIADLSQVQQQQILEVLSDKAANQRVQIESAFEKMTQVALAQAFQSGELQGMIDRKIEENTNSGNEITLQAMVEAWTEEQLMLPLEEAKNILPTSSTN